MGLLSTDSGQSSSYIEDVDTKAARRYRFLGLFLAGLLGVPGIVRSASQVPQPWQWPVSTPEEQGLDSGKLTELRDLIRQGKLCPELHSLLIARHGYLVVEEYFNGWQADGLHTLQSVSKSFTSALVGIAVARGEFKGVDEKVLDFFPDMKEIAYLDERKKTLRLEDLLTMRSGTDFHERDEGSPYRQMMRLMKGWDKFYLDRPMLQQPGTSFLYDSGGVILISSMLKNCTGMHAAEYAERFLFAPLGIEKKIWMRNQEGHTHAGGGLALTARDAAKFGLLYLNSGRWGNEQVVPESWVQESFHKRVDLAGHGQPPLGYGYLWWIFAPDPRGKAGQDIFAARGRYGQYILVVPEHDMVVVIYAMIHSVTDQNKPTDLFYDRILTAVRR
jgi:CubicO group peptidase (beta-lactamase class C family)